MEELFMAIPVIVSAVIAVVGLILFFSPFIIIWRLGKISVTLQEMNNRMKDKDE